MHRWTKILRVVLFIFISSTLIIHIFPNALIVLSNISKLNDNQINNILMTFDIVISFIIALYSLIEQKAAEKRCLYEFKIEKDNLGFESYRRFPTELNYAYSYDYHRKTIDGIDIEKPYYLIEVGLQENALCSIGIPLRIKISTELYGKCIIFSNLNIVAMKDGKVKAKKINLSKNLIINMPIKDGKFFLIRILLLCDHELEQELLDSCIYLSFTLTFKDDRNKIYNKYIFLKIQNVMGESRILSISSKNNWISYILKLGGQGYHINKKREV